MLEAIATVAAAAMPAVASGSAAASDLYVYGGFTWAGGLIDVVKRMDAEERAAWIAVDRRVGLAMLNAIEKFSRSGSGR
jgi:hypothetical protein